MSDNARDTQFQGFAKLLLKELVDDMLDEYGFMDREQYESGELASAEEIIAQHAYDLVKYAFEKAIDDHDAEIAITDVPDMTEWPPEVKPEPLTLERCIALVKERGLSYAEHDGKVTLYAKDIALQTYKIVDGVFEYETEESMVDALDAWAKHHGGVPIVSEYIPENEMVVLPEGVELYDPNTRPRQISFTTSDGKKFEGIVHYVGEAKEQDD